VGDVDPRIGEHLLDVLGAARIAAYLQPSTDMHPITRTTSLPARPTDRLFVDRAHLETAEDYLRQVTARDPRDRDPRDRDPRDRDPETGERDVAPDVPTDAAGPAPDASRDANTARDTTARDTTARDAITDRAPGTGRGPAAGRPADADLDEPDVDAAWLEIVAGYDATVDPDDPPWPKSEEVTLTEPRALPTIEPGLESRPLRRVEPAEPSLLDALDTFGATLPADDDEGYIPPPPPPLPRISAVAGLGVAAIAFGLLLFVWPGLLPLDGDTVLLLAFGSIVAGFGTLIWRLRPGDDEEDDLDDGARI
jgi:hypothetical protein